MEAKTENDKAVSFLAIMRKHVLGWNHSDYSALEWGQGVLFVIHYYVFTGNNEL